MIVSINQPAYLPWLGYFHRIAISDIHIVLDHVQFEKNSFVNRNKIRTNNGWTWLTVPVKTKGRFGELPINKLEIDNSTNWRQKHWATVKQNYSKAPHFHLYSDFFEDIYRRDWNLLNDLCRETNAYILSVLDIDTKIIESSALHPQEKKSALILELCRVTSASVYYSGIMGKDYLREEEFNANGIAVRYQNFQPYPYPQLQGGEFVPFMSILDLLFNCGEKSRDILLANQDQKCHLS